MTLEMDSKGHSNPISVEEEKTGVRRSYRLCKGNTGAPVALVLPSPSTNSFAVEKYFDQVWNMEMIVDLPRTSAMEADLEEDVSALHWRSIPPVTGLKAPLSVLYIKVNGQREDQKEKKDKKRKHID